jgi:hypothetical protein
VAGSFYPSDPIKLSDLVDRLLEAARPVDAAETAITARLAGILVPHAGLVFSGSVAAVAWHVAAMKPQGITSLVMLGTNHGAWWLDGVGIWDRGVWRTPLGDVEVDESLAEAIAALGPPFTVDREAHRTEHSLEVQLPFVRRAMPEVSIVPLAVGAGTDDAAVRAGHLLGTLLAARHASGARIGLVISTDMAHYPPAAIGARITDELAPDIVALEPTRLASREARLANSGLEGVACGMCGIQPTVLGLAALRAMGVERGFRLAAATSADAGGSSGRTVGYLAAAFPG